MTPEKKPLPAWLKLLLAGSIGAGAVTGSQKLATDSPVHFAVEGVPPTGADGWDCKPEGGLVGAPLVCRPKNQMGAETGTGTNQ